MQSRFQNLMCSQIQEVGQNPADSAMPKILCKSVNDLTFGTVLKISLIMFSPHRLSTKDLYFTTSYSV